MTVPEFAGAFLNATDQLVFLTLGKLVIIVDQQAPFLPQLANSDVPVAL
jgi:hypothetical protein